MKMQMQMQSRCSMSPSSVLLLLLLLASDYEGCSASAIQQQYEIMDPRHPVYSYIKYIHRTAILRHACCVFEMPSSAVQGDVDFLPAILPPSILCTF